MAVAATWVAAQPDRAAGVDRLVEEVCGESRGGVEVLAGLGAIGEVAGDQAVPAVRRQLDGPHDGVVLTWLAQRSAIDPDTIDPARLLAGLIDVLAAILDDGGPAEVTAFLGDATPDQHVELLERIWRVTHPRLADVLQTIGAHHPNKIVAKAARKAVIRHRSFLANPSRR